MKPTSILLILVAATCATIRASTWNFTESSALEAWSTIGLTQQSTGGLVLGPSDGSFAISGIHFKNPVEPAKNLKLKVQLGDLKVNAPAPDNLENENDIRINIVLGSLPKPAWDSDKAVINLALFLNSRHDGLYAALYGKGEGFPNKSPDPLTPGDFLGEGSGNGEISVELALNEQTITAHIRRGETILKTFEAPMSENLKGLLSTPLYAFIYQQNIGDGTGQITVRSISLE